ncbi:uncharacterized protein STEHIDRAFT_123684 [Stereum hirsutum FP-91666 SS1]|uniref:uncharacterized protein n=1 Tax=Stereum hirsutum (strain FP-91666) TaxID=721885 RepID=UPI000444A17C|nr:uncharacterized protein STEHIDRAFT_123684 [Stereum hirsutum FP-91666 SS1]EIM83238.1 hypothetical protein STEHIDRAFT_123684 [Stereum hirsutum FP-91666 SS1]
MQLLAIASLVVFAFSGVQAYNPIGQPCDSPGGYGCSQDASINGGNAFVYTCSGSDVFVYSAGCACPTCCVATTGGAYCT